MSGINLSLAQETLSTSSERIPSSSTIIAMTHPQVLSFAKDLISKGDYHNAKKALLAKPYQDKQLEIERLYLLAQIATFEQNYDEAIDIYHFILDYEPNIPNIRFRLAELYLRCEDWWRANYHYRLALANKNLPLEIKKHISQALYYIRQNKNWNAWFEFGIAPDNNINNTTTGEQCVMTLFGVVCHRLDEKEKDVGLNLSAGGSYEHKLSQNWRLHHEFSLSTIDYEQKEYDDWFFYYVLGAKYIFPKGDVLFGPSFSKRYLGHRAYNYTTGLTFRGGYDLTPQLHTNLILNYTPTTYNDFGDVLDGDVKSTQIRFFYALDSAKYLIMKSGYEYEKTKNKTYSNDRINFALGFGAELAYGFHIYVEPSLLFTHYKESRWTVKDLHFEKIREKDITQRYSLSLSNRKLNLWGMTPTLTYSFTKKTSNIWQREYQKSLIEFSIQKSF